MLLELTKLNDDKVLINTDLIDSANTFSGNAKSYKTAFALNPKTMIFQVRKKTTLGRVLCVGTQVTHSRALARNLANSGHVKFTLQKYLRVTAPKSCNQINVLRLTKCAYSNIIAQRSRLLKQFKWQISRSAPLIFAVRGKS